MIPFSQPVHCFPPLMFYSERASPDNQVTKNKAGPEVHTQRSQDWKEGPP